MRVPGSSRIRASTQWIRRRFTRHALILLYHRVTELPSDPQRLCVTPQHFAEHLEVIRQQYCPSSLQGLGAALRQGHVPDRAIAVTFDDGYVDNLQNAKPLLEGYEIPATVFVTTGYMDSQREFWWDEIERLFLQPGRLPRKLSLTIGGRSHAWELGEIADYGTDAYASYRKWDVLTEDDPTSRQRAYRSCCQLLRGVSGEERSKALGELRAVAGIGPLGRPTHRSLSAEEVIQLGDGGLVEVGSHSVTHPVLSDLPTPAQRAEIHESKARLECILGHPVTSFAYPYGGPADYSEETVRLVQDCGFTCACINSPDMVQRGSSHFRLPRCLVRDWDGEELARRLHWWFPG